MKNLIILFVLLIGCCNHAYAQGCPSSLIYIGNQNDIDVFPVFYPDCTEPEGIILFQNINPDLSIKNLDGLSIITRINGILKIEEMDSLTNFSGFENLTYVDSLIINDNENLSDISALNILDSVDYLTIFLNPQISDFSNFSSLNKVVSDLTIYKNNAITSLTGFENLEIAGELFISQNDSLADISALSNITKTSSLLVSNNPELTSLDGLQNIDSVENGVFITSNQKLINLNGLANLSYIGEKFSMSSNPLVTNFLGLENLKYIGMTFNVTFNDSLENFVGLEMLDYIGGHLIIGNNESLNHLGIIGGIDLSSVSYLAISGNESLSLCSERNICNYIINGGLISPNIDNAPGCDSLNEILDGCNSDFWKIHSEVFFDLNQNKIKDLGEPFLPDVGLEILPIESTIFSNQINNITTYLENGNYVIQYDPNSLIDWNLTTDSLVYHFSLGDSMNSDTLSFGYYPIEHISKMNLVINGAPARCGETITFQTHAKNLGTTITNGTLWLEVDATIAATNFIDIPDTTIAPNLYGWHFENLFPGYSFDAGISLQVPTPPNVFIGDSLYFNSFVEYSDINGTTITDVFYYPTEVRCSFDPNDKLVNPSRNNNLTLFEEDLIYTIRFQNTGNDEAYDIIIRDTLDENSDPSTFRVLSTSHPNSLITAMEADQFLTFNFENIYLPDSTTNFDASQGYVSYLISPKEGLAEETLIENTASIYFDFNPPIVTNTTESVMVSELPTSIYNLGGEEGMKIEIFPNPVSENIFIKKEKSETLAYQITDVNGRLLKNGELIDETSNITFTKMNSGVYFIKIINPTTREYIVEKIVK